MRKDIEAVKAQTGSVVAALQYAQHKEGYISRVAVNLIADVFNVSSTEVYSTASFYHQFSFTKKGKNIISVCMGTACFVLGAEEILKTIEKHLGIKEGEVTKDGKFSIEKNTRCVGQCAGAPVVVINDKFYEHATAKGIIEVLDAM